MDKTIIDVRESYEFSAGHIKGAINIPLGQLINRLVELDKNNIIIVYCASGARSAIAENMLLNNGFKNVINGINQDNLEKMSFDG